MAPDYAADLSVPIFDRGRNAKRKGDRLMYIVQCSYVSTYNYYYYVSFVLFKLDFPKAPCAFFKKRFSIRLREIINELNFNNC